MATPIWKLKMRRALDAISQSVAAMPDELPESYERMAFALRGDFLPEDGDLRIDLFIGRPGTLDALQDREMANRHDRKRAARTDGAPALDKTQRVTYTQDGRKVER